MCNALAGWAGFQVQIKAAHLGSTLWASGVLSPQDPKAGIQEFCQFCGTFGFGTLPEVSVIRYHGVLIGLGPFKLAIVEASMVRIVKTKILQSDRQPSVLQMHALNMLTLLRGERAYVQHDTKSALGRSLDILQQG